MVVDLGEDRSVLAARATLPDHVVRRDFAEQTVALNLQTGHYHGLNPTAARMLEAILGVPAVGDALPDLARQLGVGQDVVARDLVTLCRQLAGDGLIRLG